MSQSNLECFKAYDIRGKVPESLNENLAYKIGRTFVSELTAKTVVVGHDIRLDSEKLANALKKGITEAGADVLDIGLCGTEEVYFHTSRNKADGGIMVTASHNPKNYNGMKLVSKGAKPISSDSGLKDIEYRILHNALGSCSSEPGQITPLFDKQSYISHLLTYINQENLTPLKIVLNPGNGSAGVMIKQLIELLPFNCILINQEPDGNFPNGVPNPLLPENRYVTSQAVKNHQADFGVAWDGDFDRCFLFDENGDYVEGYYLVGLLAKILIESYGKAKIIHDPRLTWNTIEQVKQAGGTPVQSKTGHSFMKESMRKEGALYGGEMSAHHYFKDFAYSDSGMIPWLLISEVISTSGKSLSSLVEDRRQAYPCSGELNYKVENIESTLDKIEAHFKDASPEVDKTDGVSLDFGNWRMNVRPSNTEQYFRLNIESRANKSLIEEKIKEVEGIIK